MKKQILLQLFLITIISMTLFSCTGNKKTVPVVNDSVNMADGVAADSTLKTAEPTAINDSLDKKEKEEKEEKK